jgi:hypothetical protein
MTAANWGLFCPHFGFEENTFLISPGTGHRSQVLEMLPAFSFISYACSFRAGDGASFFFQLAR